MLKLRYYLPGKPCTYYNLAFSCVGPLEAIHGTTPSGYDMATEVAVYDSIAQSPGLYGENNVEHTQYQGTAEQVIENEALYASAPVVGLNGFISYPSYDTSGNITGCTYYGLETEFDTVRECRLILKFADGNPSEFYYYDFIEWRLKDMYLIQGTRYYAPSDGKTYNYLRDTLVVCPSRLPISSMKDLLSLATWFQRTRSGGYMYKVGTFTAPTLDIPKIVKKITDSVLVSSDKVASVAPPRRDLGELAYQAFSNGHTIQTNALAFLLDLRNIADLVPKLKNLKSLKGVSSQYLATQYGILPTISDIKEIYNAAVKRSKNALSGLRDKTNLRIYQAGYTDYLTGDNSSSREIVHRIKIAVDDDDSNVLLKLYHKLDDVGLLPDLNTIWDLVPYSFVMDWFIDVGDFLDRVDSRLQLSTMDVRYVTMSYKATDTQCLKPSPGIPFNIDYTKRYYHRWVSDQCPTPPLSPTATQSFDHWVEASALIYQRKR